MDLVIVVVVVPIQVPALLVMERAIRRGHARLAPGEGPRVLVLAHNVVPHETHLGGERLMSRMLSAADGVLVHSPELAAQARAHRARRVLVADLPPHLPGGPPPRDNGAGRPARPAAGPTRVLALGMVRHYKGVDLLLEAAADVPGVSVTVAGEQWGRAGARVRELAADPRLTGRVRLEAGYVPGAQIPALVAGHDVLALPYRHATASQNVLLGHAHGLPVIATDVGTFGQQVRDGVDGLVVPPGDVPALATALRDVSRPDRLAALRGGVRPVDLDEPWQRYLQTLLHDPGEELS